MPPVLFRLPLGLRSVTGTAASDASKEARCSFPAYKRGSFLVYSFKIFGYLFGLLALR